MKCFSSCVLIHEAVKAIYVYILSRCFAIIMTALLGCVCMFLALFLFLWWNSIFTTCPMKSRMRNEIQKWALNFSWKVLSFFLSFLKVHTFCVGLAAAWGAIDSHLLCILTENDFSMCFCVFFLLLFYVYCYILRLVLLKLTAKKLK